MNVTKAIKAVRAVKAKICIGAMAIKESWKCSEFIVFDLGIKFLLTTELHGVIHSIKLYQIVSNLLVVQHCGLASSPIL
jgi:hypothetical protein